jgi:hypothetical protein
VFFYLNAERWLKMSFEETSHNREIAFITRLLSIFGAVEYRQMRELFSHLSESRYGKILNRLRLEGAVSYSHGAKYLSTSQYALGRAQIQESVRVFWAFIKMKDRVLDFSASAPPALLTFTSGPADYDLIPVSADNQSEIEAAADNVPEKTKRLLVVDSLDEVSTMNFRKENDFVLVVGKDGDTKFYGM